MAATTGLLVHLDRHLHSPRETVTDRQQTTMAILEAADVSSIAASPGEPRMDRLATVPASQQVGPLCPTERGEDHVEHAGGRSQLLPQSSQELGSHRRAHVVVFQRRPDPVGINARGYQVVGGEGNHRINPPRRSR